MLFVRITIKMFAFIGKKYFFFNLIKNLFIVVLSLNTSFADPEIYRSFLSVCVSQFAVILRNGRALILSQEPVEKFLTP